METLLAVVLFFGVLTAAATAYRAAEKRSSKRTSVTQPTEPPVSYGIVTPSPSVDATVPPITPTESPQKSSEASPPRVIGQGDRTIYCLDLRFYSVAQKILNLERTARLV